MNFLKMFLLLALLAAQTQAPAQSSVERKVEALERQRFEAMVSKNTTFLDGVLAENLTYTHSNGLVETKAEHLKNIETGTLIYQSMQPESITTRRYGKTIVLTGVIRVKGILKEKSFELKLRYTDVYVKQKGHWRLAAWHSVRLEN